MKGSSVGCTGSCTGSLLRSIASRFVGSRFIFVRAKIQSHFAFLDHAMNIIHFLAQNVLFSTSYVWFCQQIPVQIKTELQRLRERRDNASGGKQYWADGCVALGVYETEQGLRLGKESSTKTPPEKKRMKSDKPDV